MSEVCLEREAFACFRQAVLDVENFPPAEFSLAPYREPLSELEAFLVPLHKAKVTGVWRASCEVGIAQGVDSYALRVAMVAAVKRADGRLFYWPSRLHHFCSSSIVRYKERRVVGSCVFGIRVKRAPVRPVFKIEIDGLSGAL